MRHVVLVGAGHAHLEVLRRFCAQPPDARVTLISPLDRATYSGLWPGVVAGLYRPDEAEIRLEPLLAFKGAAFIADEVVGLDPDGRQVTCRRAGPVPFDLLSLDVGSAPDLAAVPGASEHAIPLKPLDALLPRLDAVAASLRDGRGARVAVVGAGAAGVEMLLAVERRLRCEAGRAGREPNALAFVLVTDAADILPAFPGAARRRVRRVLARRGIEVATGARVIAVKPGALVREAAPPVPADHVLWATGGAAPAWLEGTGLPLDEDGFLRVDACLQAVGRQDVFAAGDAVAFAPQPLPKSGVHAVRMGPVLADNVRASLLGRPLRPFLPQRHALAILSTGERFAVATRNALSVEGRWVWRWKDWLDRRFVARFDAGQG